MLEVQKQIAGVDNLLAQMYVSGDNVILLYQARTLLKQIYNLYEEKPKEEKEKE